MLYARKRFLFSFRCLQSLITSYHFICPETRKVEFAESCCLGTNLCIMMNRDSSNLVATSAPALNSRKAVVDALAGSLSGLCGVIVGQPFDTIRVRQQTKVFTSSSGSSMISLIRENLHSMHANFTL